MSSNPSPSRESQTARELLRHTLATLAYRGAKALRGAPTDFDCFQVAQGARSPGQLLAHICDLLDWAATMVKGKAVWHDSEPTWWDQDIARFHAALMTLDDYFASEAPLANTADRIFQGPIADALTHVGQIAMLRRLAGNPIKGESYFVADIETGTVGPNQKPPKREF